MRRLCDKMNVNRNELGGCKIILRMMLCGLMIWMGIVCLPQKVSSRQAKDVELIGQLGGRAYDVHVVGDYAYLAYSSGRYIIDMTNKSKPHLVGKCLTPGQTYGVYVWNNYAYVADYESGLRVIDVSDTSNPNETGFYDTLGASEGVYVFGNYAYIADGDAGIRIIDVSEPGNPNEVGYYDTPDKACGVYVLGNNAYIADEGAGLRVIYLTRA